MPTDPGNMTEGTHDAMELIVDEIEKLDTKMNIIDNKIDDHGRRLTAMEMAEAEILKKVDQITEKLDVEQVEQKAAVMDAFQRFVGSWFGKVILILFLICGGLSVAYIVDHAAGVSAIAEAVHK